MKEAIDGRILGPFIARYEGWCMTNGDEVKPGERIGMVKGVGVWHDACGKPRSLAMYVKEAQEGRTPARGFGR